MLTKNDTQKDTPEWWMQNLFEMGNHAVEVEKEDPNAADN